MKSEDTVSSLSEGGWVDPRTVPESLIKSTSLRSSNASLRGELGSQGVFVSSCILNFYLSNRKCPIVHTLLFHTFPVEIKFLPFLSCESDHPNWYR